MADTVRIYVKGAPEIVIANSQSHYNAHGQKEPFDNRAKQGVLGLMTEKMTGNGLRAMAFSYRDMTTQDFSQLMRRMSGDIDSEQEIRVMEDDLCFLALIALKDPI